MARRAPLSSLVLALAAACTACAPQTAAAPKVAGTGPHGEPHATAPAAELVSPEVELDDHWKGLGAGCSYLAPKGEVGGDDGGVDLVFHFHAGQMSEREMRESGMNAVFVSCGFGIGTGPYAKAFTDPNRFGRIVDTVVRSLDESHDKKGLHVRRVALVSWSAGFAAIGRILRVPRYYDMVDSVVLLDSLHAGYTGPKPHAAALGVERVDVKGLATFVRFARDAARGDKTMVMTHSSIIPPDYASSAEATGAVLAELRVPTAPAEETNERGMTLYYRADSGDLHVRGFRGRGPRDHFAHLHLIGEVLRSWVVPRWKRADRLVYTHAGEQR